MSIEDLLKSLSQDYLSSIPEKIAVIERQIAAQETDNLRESFHKLKGTGTTYGLPEVSTIGTVLESICCERPNVAVAAAAQAVMILRDIHASRSQQRPYDCERDSRLSDIRKLLQN